MDREVVAKALLVGGSLALVLLGPALQAAGEMREYRQLLGALRDSDVPGVMRGYLT